MLNLLFSNLPENALGLAIFVPPAGPDKRAGGPIGPAVCRLLDIDRFPGCAQDPLKNRDYLLQGGWGGWPTGNGKKLSSSQAQLGQATCLAVA